MGSKGKRRQEREAKKDEKVLQDLEQHKGMSKYQRKEMARRLRDGIR